MRLSGYKKLSVAFGALALGGMAFGQRPSAIIGPGGVYDPNDPAQHRPIMPEIPPEQPIIFSGGAYFPSAGETFPLKNGVFSKRSALTACTRDGYLVSLVKLTVIPRFNPNDREMSYFSRNEIETVSELVELCWQKAQSKKNLPDFVELTSANLYDFYSDFVEDLKAEIIVATNKSVIIEPGSFIVQKPTAQTVCSRNHEHGYHDLILAKRTNYLAPVISIPGISAGGVRYNAVLTVVFKNEENFRDKDGNFNDDELTRIVERVIYDGYLQAWDKILKSYPDKSIEPAANGILNADSVKVIQALREAATTIEKTLKSRGYDVFVSAPSVEKEASSAYPLTGLQPR